MDNENAYLPKLAKIISIKEEVSGARPIKTFRAQLLTDTNFS
ncbi:MAG: heterodisulfide reductase subunit F, partial [Candidatus Aminicenantes bacterium]|nr:heterodisulfide reductase subunit F [Candidatus Aminicenantes bacterium]